MKNSIPVPEFLNLDKVIELNNRLIENCRIFAFLGMPECLLRAEPTSYGDAFEIYIIKLYVLYHDYGMKFIQVFLDEAKNYRQYTYAKHVDTVEKMRSLLAHSYPPNTANTIYSRLNNYYFKNDNSFKYTSWQDFFVNANDEHWKKLICKIIADADKLYEMMNSISNDEENTREISKTLKNDFENGCCGDLKIFEQSFDGRFFRLMCKDLYDTLLEDGYKKQEVRRICKNLYENREYEGDKSTRGMKSEIIKKFKSNMEEGNYYDTEIIYNGLKQLIVEEIKSKLTPLSESVSEDFFE